MSDEHRYLADLIQRLKQQRDELRLQIHLGKAEAKEELARLEERLERLMEDYEPVKEAMAETTANVASGLQLVAQEIQEGFVRVAKSLRKDS